jgi:hypothetical protein
VESGTRRRLSGIGVAGILAAVFGGAVAWGSAGPTEQRGVFALLGGTPKIVSEFWAAQGAGSSATLKIRQFQPNGTTPILNYDVDMQRLMHLIVVRDDFATFAHLHPAFDTTTGTFSQAFTKAPNHRYYVYADTMPQSIGQQVFRFTTESDVPLAASPGVFGVSATTTAVPPYTVTLSQTTLAASLPQRLNVAILETSQPARDLSTYLGAAAHAVFINTSTLAYVHVHPTVRGAATMAMGMSRDAGPFMQMQLPALPAGTYKLWIEFHGANDRVYTAPFTILVR